jgi:uncharacterized protein
MIARLFRRAFPCLLLASSAAASAGSAADGLPPVPADHVLDSAGMLDAAQRTLLSYELKQFERQTSNQMLVVILPEVPDGEVMEDYTQRVAEAWGAGRKDRDNGMVLFVFPGSRQLRVEVGYGLEGAVPDVLASRIINEEMVPSFRAGDMGGGIIRGADALMAAARGEYEGSGRTLAEERAPPGELVGSFVFWMFLVIFVIVSIQRSQGNGGTVYTPRGRRDVFFPGHSGGGGFGGGGFSGGGGRFGGGGASGRW